MWAYWTVFGSSLLAATILPFSSEVVLVGALLKGYSPWLLWLFAAAGNTFGSLINWIIGRYISHLRHRKWFPFKENNIEKAEDWFNRFGMWSLLFAWLPVAGDALTFIAGILRVKMIPFVILVAIGKGARYAVIVYLTLQAQGLTH